MDTVTRRRFLIASGVTGGVALATGSGLVTWHELSQRAGSDPQPVGSKILVLVTLYGGNDGINTLVPYADPAYHDARPELAYAEGEVLHLDASVGLNPAMKGMATLWREGRLAIVRGVGYPHPDHSHFRSMDIWQTASPDTPITTGWIGRWLDATGAHPRPRHPAPRPDRGDHRPGRGRPLRHPRTSVGRDQLLLGTGRRCDPCP